VRTQRQYQIFPGESITAVPVTESIDQGCNVELTQLETNGNAWWSLAKPGEDDCLMEHLQAVASCVFKSYRGSNLQAKILMLIPVGSCAI